MATTNVTVSLEAELLERVRAEAAAAGMSVSAWLGRAARAYARRGAAQRHEAWLQANPQTRDELDGFAAFARRNRPGWADLGESA